MEDLLTVKEAAAEIGISESSVWQAIREDRLPCSTKWGRKVISRTDALTYKTRTQQDGAKPRGRPRKVRVDG